MTIDETIQAIEASGFRWLLRSANNGHDFGNEGGHTHFAKVASVVIYGNGAANVLSTAYNAAKELAQ